MKIIAHIPCPHVFVLPHAHPPHLKDTHWACTWGPARHPPGIPPESLLEHALDLGHQLSSAQPLGPCSWERGGKQLYEYHINQLKINY